MKCICSVALVCAVSVVSSARVSAPVGKRIEPYKYANGPLLSKDEIMAELNSKEMTSEETCDVLGRAAGPIDTVQGHFVQVPQ